jgi:integrase
MNTSPGSWISKRLIDGSKLYSEKAFATADDLAPENGVDILSFSEALKRARAVIQVPEKRRDNRDSGTGPTVEEVLSNYWRSYSRARESSKTSQFENKLKRIKASALLRKRPASTLKAQEIEQWLNSLLQETPRRGHGRTGGTRPLNVPEPGTLDYESYLNRRKRTANSYLSILKAALNLAWRSGQIESNDAWSGVRPFVVNSRPEIRVLTSDEQERLLRSCPPALLQLVRGALETAARYGELASLTVGNYQADARIIHFPSNITKNHRARSIHLAREGALFFDEVTVGRSPEERIFLKENGKPWLRGEQGPHLRRACRRAKITPSISFHVLRHTAAVSLIKKGISFVEISSVLGHVDTRIALRQYSDLAESSLKNLVR